jgi:hypothetical protein
MVMINSTATKVVSKYILTTNSRGKGTKRPSVEGGKRRRVASFLCGQELSIQTQLVNEQSEEKKWLLMASENAKFSVAYSSNRDL